MSSKHRFPAAALLFGALVCQVCAAQTGKPATTAPTSKPNTSPSSATSPAATQPAASESSPATAPSGTSSCNGGPCDYPQPHITSVNPPPAPVPDPWPLQDRIKWLGVALLLLIAYPAILIALSTLRKIERQTRYAETTALAAAEVAKAALVLAESQAKAARPWILVLADPTPGIANSFSVVATNRGSSPARIVSLIEGTTLVEDEARLPTVPAFKTEPRAPLVPLILLPGESTTIKTFTRDEVKSVCENPVQVQRVEDWEEKIYLFGNVAYTDLVASGGAAHETGWCCWYIHGRQKSGMVMAGPPEYNRHT